MPFCSKKDSVHTNMPVLSVVPPCQLPVDAPLLSPIQCEVLTVTILERKKKVPKNGLRSSKSLSIHIIEIGCIPVSTFMSYYTIVCHAGHQPKIYYGRTANTLCHVNKLIQTRYVFAFCKFRIVNNC
jgi:hypothetical protein